MAEAPKSKRQGRRWLCQGERTYLHGAGNVRALCCLCAINFRIELIDCSCSRNRYFHASHLYKICMMPLLQAMIEEVAVRNISWAKLLIPDKRGASNLVLSLHFDGLSACLSTQHASSALQGRGELSGAQICFVLDMQIEMGPAFLEHQSLFLCAFASTVMWCSPVMRCRHTQVCGGCPLRESSSTFKDH